MNKNVVAFVEERLPEINTSMSTVVGTVDNMDKRIEELKLEGDIEELRWEMQVAVNPLWSTSTRRSKPFKCLRPLRMVNSKLVRSRLRSTRRWSRLWKHN